MLYIVRWKQYFSRVDESVRNENECATSYDTCTEDYKYINEHVSKSFYIDSHSEYVNIQKYDEQSKENV